MIRYIFGISIITLIIIALRFLLKERISKKLQYMLWLAIPLFMILSPLFSIRMTVPKDSFLAKHGFIASEKSSEEMGVNAVVTEEKNQEQVILQESRRKQQNTTEKVDTEVVSTGYMDLTCGATQGSAMSNATSADERMLDTTSMTVRKTVNWSFIAASVKYVVMCIILAILLIYNVGYVLYCRKRRSFLKKDETSKLKVYHLPKCKSPFLLGRSIYINDAVIENERAAEYAIYHEYCHYKHGDSLWAIVKYVVIAINWYNPLIWVAFLFVEQDCELACDEAVMAHFGDAKRVEYGKVLLSLLTVEPVAKTDLSISTALKGRNKNNLKDRITNIKKKNKVSIIAVILALVAVLGVSVVALVKYNVKDNDETIEPEETAKTEYSKEESMQSSKEASKETETDTTTSTTNATTAETVLPMPKADSIEVQIDSNLQTLNFTNDPVVRITGKLEEENQWEDRAVEEDGTYADRPTLTTEGYDKIGEIINSISSKKHVSYSYPLCKSIEFTRADEQICSFATLEQDEYSYTSEYYTFDTISSEPLDLDKVITDRSLFADALQSQYPECADIASEIRDNVDISFLLYQNCIAFRYDDYEEVRVSTMNLGYCVDLSYFTSTPEFYTLISDSHGYILWDVDGDGFLDSVRGYTSEDPLYYCRTILEYNEQVFKEGNAYDDADDLGYVKDIYLVKTDDGFYLYVNGIFADMLNYTTTFHFENNGFEKSGGGGSFLTFPCNPDNCYITHFSDTLGTGIIIENCSLIGNHGEPECVSPFQRKVSLRNVFFNKFDLEAKTCDRYGKEDGRSITIPTESAIRLVCIDSENKKAIMAILNTDGTDQVYFQMDVVLCEDYAYDCDIVYQEKTYRIWGDSEDDLRQKDMFYGVKYGG